MFHAYFLYVSHKKFIEHVFNMAFVFVVYTQKNTKKIVKIHKKYKYTCIQFYHILVYNHALLALNGSEC